MPPASPSRPSAVDRARTRLRAALLKTGSQVFRLVRSAVGGEPPLYDPPLAEMPQAPVVVYFAEEPELVYQVLQWLPVMEQVAQRQPVVVVTRQWDTTALLRGRTDLPVLFHREFEGLRRVYDRLGAKTVLYVNNGTRNFQSLIYQRALHVHLNHGESDKISMVSNQAKAYDVVAVAGQAAVERHRRALINFDLDRLAVCGRPQLDLEVPAALTPVAGRRTVLYAPTWSGEDDANNYTSLDRYGVAIVRALVGRDDVRVVYKPHPRVLTTVDKGVAAAHEEICRLLAGGAGQAGHAMPFEANILGLFDGVDLMVTDVSSVGLDFLYLRPDAPIVLTDRRTDRVALRADAPVSTATDVIDADNVGDVATLLAANLTSDPHAAGRAQASEHYFGFARGESSQRFGNLVAECVARRDALVAGD
jgi:hypothetical protein